MGIITQLKPSYLIAGGSIAITLCLGLILRSSIVSADDVIDNVAITVESSCSMSGNINTAHTANLKNSTYSGAEGSTYENGIGKTTLTAFCNDQNGFSIYAVGYTGNIAGNTDLVGANNGSFIPTGTAVSGDTSNWAMKVTKVNNPGGQQPDVTYNPQNMTITNSFNNFHAVPDTYTKVAEYHAETGSSATDQGPGALGAKIETTYATYVSADQYADTYTGQVKYVMVHPHDTAAPVTPPAPLATCNTPFPGIAYMQEINDTNKAAILASIDEEVPYFLRDSRDEQPYCVAKLKDGKLWMIENLNLAGGTAISADTSDVIASYIESFTTSNNLTKDASNNTIILPASAIKNTDNNNLTDNMQFRYSNYSYIFNSGNKDNCGTSGQSTTPCYSYYSYDVATLGSGRTISTNNADSPYSICPKGWKLPTSKSFLAANWQTISNFYVLAHQYGLDSTTSTSENDSDFYDQAGPGTILNFLIAGYYDAGLFHGGNGRYLSSTSAYDDNLRSYQLGFGSNSVNSAIGDPRSYGCSLRCFVGE